uniref:anoctamin-7 isoform X4 n=1 Tax=Callithrix jacchus TaxID=9483 RepID=UPI0023DD2B0C|nr:anoctamin-7 isoform X4 [Callithrix jacchus]XP_054114346.1 anoctamin-7 isoform X4 [Callithrix jacchus]XP_054114347.1 anoctamin-7 isoform X4 [Callithrix jacchus]
MCPPSTTPAGSDFLGSDNQDTFFTSTKRHQILFEILAKTPYGHEKKNLLGIHQLLAEGVFSAAFPLHDGPFKAPPEGPQAPRLNQRQVLFRHWARWGKWSKYQPLDHVRRYFGEKVALYFAWLGFYTGWLLPAAVVGTLVFLVGCFLVFSDIPTQELCGSQDSFEMCPLCLDCPFWLLSSACALAQAGRLFDHGGTVFFSLFMALWAVLFLEYWKRKSATLAYRWDCSDYEDIEERPRPQFAASAPMTAPNPITGEDEPYFPERSRARRMLAGSVVIVVMVAVVVMCLVSVILYRTIMAILVSRSGNTVLTAWASRIASLTGSVVNLIFIVILSKIYVTLAHVLTRWEMHRTQTKFEDSFTLKVFIFQFVNFYSSPIYIAFFKGSARLEAASSSWHRSSWSSWWASRSSTTCRRSSSRPECSLVSPAPNTEQEGRGKRGPKLILRHMSASYALARKLKGWWQKFRLRSKRKAGASSGAGREPWEADYELVPCEGLFDEYLEMVLQFGFVTIFVAACPLAPLFALLNNWVEIRLDARKFVCEYRRPVAERAQDIGIWFPVLTAITHLAVTSNAFLLAFSSDFLPRAYYQWTRAHDLRGFVNFTLARAPPHFAAAHNRTCRYRAFRDDHGHYSQTYWNLLAIRLAFVIVFEHVVFSIGRVLDLLVPDIPESVQIKVKREYYLAKQALAENEVNHAASLGSPQPSPILVSGCCTSGHQVTSLFLLLPFLGDRLFLEQMEQRMSRPRAQRQWLCEPLAAVVPSFLGTLPASPPTPASLLRVPVPPSPAGRDCLLTEPCFLLRNLSPRGPCTQETLSLGGLPRPLDMTLLWSCHPWPHLPAPLTSADLQMVLSAGPSSLTSSGPTCLFLPCPCGDVTLMPQLSNPAPLCPRPWQGSIRPLPPFPVIGVPGFLLLESGPLSILCVCSCPLQQLNMFVGSLPAECVTSTQTGEALDRIFVSESRQPGRKPVHL